MPPEQKSGVRAGRGGLGRPKGAIHGTGAPASGLLGNVYESFSDVGEIRVYFASKILTPCRMH